MRIITFLTFLLAYTYGNAQELNCQVSIVTDNKLEITSVEKEIFEQLEQTIYELMNNTQWTKDNFTVEERINCNLQLQIDEFPSTGTFSGSLQVQSSRPAYSSGYNTTLMNVKDEDITFTFSRNAVLVYAPNQFRDNLTSILAYYAYYIIGMDYDSFSLKGGTKYFAEAQQIVSNAQTTGFAGWKSNERGKRNRYWLVDNILHELYSPLRECSYEYHRKGIDVLYEDKVVARNAIYDAMNKLVKVVSTRPNNPNLINFVKVKSDEIKNLYEDAETKDKSKMVNLLKRIDPANSSKYQEILG